MIKNQSCCGRQLYPLINKRSFFSKHNIYYPTLKNLLFYSYSEML
jgi:hypothetical protein